MSGARRECGRGCTTLSLDFPAGEARYHHEPCHELTPESLFDRQWALAVLGLVLARLREDHSRKSQATQFDRLQVFLTGDRNHTSYDRVAGSLNLSDGAMPSWFGRKFNSS